jgi:hypothetical protein
MNGDLDALLARRLLAAQQAEIVEQERRLAEQAQTIADRGELIEYLQQRHAKLAEIETGGWWRLHQRLLPVLWVY